MERRAGQAGPIAAAGIICFRGDEILLIKRAKPPLAGEWSLPGGRIQWGERAADAALRELREETGAEAEILGLVDVVDGLFADSHVLLIDYAARWTAGEPRAGDDASAAAFFALEALAPLQLWPPTLAVILKAASQYNQRK